MKFQITGILATLILVAATAFSQHNPRYAGYWQSYSNVEQTYPHGYASDVLEPGWNKAVYHEQVPYHSRDCESPYPSPGVWDRHNNSMANSTYANWGQKTEPYSCERFLTKPCAPTAACGHGAAPAGAPVTFSTGNASDIYLANTAMIDELKAMYCLPSHIIHRLKSRNDAAYTRSHVGGSPSMPGSDMERSTLAGLSVELMKLRGTCVDGGVR